MVTSHEIGALNTVTQHLGNISAADAPCAAPGEASQTCNVVKIMQLASAQIGCPGKGGALCNLLSQWIQVLSGKAAPVFATQRYLLAETSLLLGGYTGAFYGSSDKDCKAGCQECCKHQQAHFPGPEADSYLGNAAMSAQLAAVPAGLDSGAITRRNMLGYILLNDMYWFDLPAGNRGLGLGGQSLEIHSYVRPIIDKAVGVAGTWTVQGVRASAAAFQASKRSTMEIQGDVKVWTQQVLHETVYGVAISEQDAHDFAEFQTKVLMSVVVPQDFVDAARKIAGGEATLHKALGFDSTVLKKKAYLGKWLPYVKARYGAGLSDEQLAVVNSNLLDALVFAGGLSVPGAIGPGIGALYASNSPAAGIKLSALNAVQYAWEATRYFPPVLGFPFVKKSETLPLKIMAVGMGQRAADAWGEDAEKPAFRLRDMATYHKYWVGHADGADNGKERRSCPGKSLSMALIEAWFLAWQQASWEPAAGTTFKFDDHVPFLGDFTMKRVDQHVIVL